MKSVFSIIHLFLLQVVFANPEREIEMQTLEVMARETVDKSNALSPETPEAEAAVERWVDFVADMTQKSVVEKVREVYADSAYLNDTLKEVQGVENIENYFLETISATDKVSAEMLDIAESKGNYYLRWVMIIKFKNLNSGQPTRTIGMSHLRFDSKGKVIYHQDYWDSTSGFYQYVPVLGRLIKAVKGRL
tara:strand:+ start:195 stop:767 length:573 start_codon:yes stop_codon:yes gene_type:complete